VRRATLAGVALALANAGCVTLTPSEQQAVTEVRAMADATARAYGVARISVLVGSNVEGVGGSYRQGLFTLSTPMLRSRHRDSIVAHELAHYLLGHDRPLAGTLALDRQREQELRELDANAKAVEILVRVRGLTEEQAVSLVYDHLLVFRRAVAANRTVVPWGHRLPCDEMHDLLARFAAHRGWTDGLPCSRGGAVLARGTPRPASDSASPTGSAAGPMASYFAERARTTRASPDGATAAPLRARSTFDRAEDTDVTLCVAVPLDGQPHRVVSRWYDESGRERRVVSRTAQRPARADAPAARPEQTWAWHTHTVPMWELRPYPGRWTAKIWLDDVPAGEASFSLA
jgi:hypothetical protein